MNRTILSLFLLLPMAWLVPTPSHAGESASRPNILFAIADDWSWPHAGAYGDKVVKTPTFDRMAREGVLFTNAYVASPSCTPSRAAILTGQWHWRLEESANLWSTLRASYPVYPDLLREMGYHVGYTRKGWGPGRVQVGGRKENAAGPRYRNFDKFLEKRPEGKPFCFWFGSQDPHRPYKRGSGVKSGMKLADVQVPGCLPDNKTVRSDLCDYYFEVQRFDREVGQIIKKLTDMGELDNTLVVITGDNGLPFPRCKSNLYDTGTHVPLAVRWGKKAKGGRTVRDFISLTDLAPTFLEAAGSKPLPVMTGQSFMDILTSTKEGQVAPQRDYVITGKERHVPAQEAGNPGGYPMRAIRTHKFLFIRNFKPERWPAGVEDPTKAYMRKRPFADIDNSPTKTFLMEHRNDPKVKRLFQLSFGKRPAEELYDLDKDPHQLHNVANQPEYAKVKKELQTRLLAELKKTRDPRVVGGAERLERYPYYGAGKKNPVPGK